MLNTVQRLRTAETCALGWETEIRVPTEPIQRLLKSNLLHRTQWENSHEGCCEVLGKWQYRNVKNYKIYMAVRVGKWQRADLQTEELLQSCSSQHEALKRHL